MKSAASHEALSFRGHWERFWEEADRLTLDQVYGTDGRILREIRSLRDLRGLRVLEVGAGSGRDSLTLAQAGGNVIAFDYSPQSLKLIKSSVSAAVPSLGIVGGDGLRLPFTDATFDLVFHQGLLEHFPDPLPLLRENVRVLKEGGILLVDVPQRYHYYTLVKHALMLLGRWFAGWEREFSISELEALLKRVGLKTLRSYGHWMVPGLWYRMLRKALLRTFGWNLPLYPKVRLVGKLGEKLRLWLSLRRLGLYLTPVVGAIARKEPKP